MVLDIGRDYKITAMKKANTKFESRIIVGLDNEFSVFLPTRISKALENDLKQFQHMLQGSIRRSTVNTLSCRQIQSVQILIFVKKNVFYEQNRNILFYLFYLISLENVKE